MPDELLLISGKAEMNKDGNTNFSFQTKTQSFQNKWDGYSFSQNFQKILEELTKPGNGCLSYLKELDIVGHRLIHGGEGSEPQDAVEITDELISYMKSCFARTASLHGKSGRNKYGWSSFTRSTTSRSFRYRFSPNSASQNLSVRNSA